MRPRLFDEEALIVKDGRARVKRATIAPSVQTGTHTVDCAESQSVSVAGLHTKPVALPYRSKLESRYATQLDLELRAGLIQGWLYEPFSLKLANGKHYRPDFLTWGEEGLTCIECKGKWIKNKRDSMTHLKWAAQRFPCFIWRLVWREGDSFNGMYVVV